MASNRRMGMRVPARMVINHYVDDYHRVSMSFNLSPEGIYVYHKPHGVAQVMGLEFELPGVEEPIWAKGELRFCARFGDYMGTGIAFTAMANRHFELVHDWVLDQRLRQMRSAIKRARLEDELFDLAA